jgi:hypothetical protein
MKVYNRVTGECFESTPETQFAQRMARMKNRVWWAVCNVSRETNFDGGRMVMITLTYRRVDQWRPTQISEWSAYWRDSVGREYVWVAELQERGAMHYHFLSSLPLETRWDKREYDRAWYHGFTYVTDDIRKPMYIMKYLQKELQKDGHKFPRGARIVGSTRPTCYIGHRANKERVVSRYPHWVQRTMDEAGGVGGVGVVSRSSNGFRFDGQLAISPYAPSALPTIVHVADHMYKAWSGDLVYNGGNWELPQTTQLHERIPF